MSKRVTLDPMVTRLHNGAWEVVDYIGNVRFRRTYYDYSKTEAVRQWKQEAREKIASGEFGIVNQNPSPSAPLTLAQAQQRVRGYGCTLRKIVETGEYRVGIVGGSEDSAYYTTDLEDAVTTASRMGRKDGAELSYNAGAVDQAIQSSNRAGRRIGGKEARAIHGLLKGWRKNGRLRLEDEYEPMLQDMRVIVKHISSDPRWTGMANAPQGKSGLMFMWNLFHEREFQRSQPDTHPSFVYGKKRLLAHLPEYRGIYQKHKDANDAHIASLLSKIKKQLIAEEGGRVVSANPGGARFLDADRNRRWVVRVVRSKKYLVGDSSPMMRHEALAERDAIVERDPSARVEVVQSEAFKVNGPAKLKGAYGDWIRTLSTFERYRRGGSANVGNNTELRLAPRSGEGAPRDVQVWLHNTPIVTFHEDDTITLNSGGWHSVTTKARMNSVLPQFLGVVQKKHSWYVHDQRDGSEVPFFDGMRIRVG